MYRYYQVSNVYFRLFNSFFMDTIYKKVGHDSDIAFFSFILLDTSPGLSDTAFGMSMSDACRKRTYPQRCVHAS